MRKYMTKYLLLIALSGAGAVACSSSTTPAGMGGAGGHATGGAGGTSTGGAGGTSTGGVGGAATGGAGGTSSGGTGGATGGAGGATGGAGGAGGIAGAGAVNAAIINATTTGGITPTRTAPTVVYPACP
jgi:hypothetical protein